MIVFPFQGAVDQFCKSLMFYISHSRLVKCQSGSAFENNLKRMEFTPLPLSFPHFFDVQKKRAVVAEKKGDGENEGSMGWFMCLLGAWIYYICKMTTCGISYNPVIEHFWLVNKQICPNKTIDFHKWQTFFKAVLTLSLLASVILWLDYATILWFAS